MAGEFSIVVASRLHSSGPAQFRCGNACAPSRSARPTRRNSHISGTLGAGADYGLLTKGGQAIGFDTSKALGATRTATGQAIGFDSSKALGAGTLG
ncbi:MAG: hypothetical protein RJA70_2064 [Pseudomonadota bacterium]|jgi:hypothetical protein